MFRIDLHRLYPRHDQCYVIGDVPRVLDLCDVQRVAAYGETSLERDVRHRARFGFAVIKERDIRNGPHLWAIWREPQA